LIDRSKNGWPVSSRRRPQCAFSGSARIEGGFPWCGGTDANLCNRACLAADHSRSRNADCLPTADPVSALLRGDNVPVGPMRRHGEGSSAGRSVVDGEPPCFRQTLLLVRAGRAGFRSRSSSGETCTAGQASACRKCIDRGTYRLRYEDHAAWLEGLAVHLHFNCACRSLVTRASSCPWRGAR